jgi:hypothetical protein
VDNLIPATQGISNFITAPDFVQTILIRNATEQQIQDCMTACNASGRIYNVYLETPGCDEEWLFRVERIADLIIHADKVNPVEYFQ